MEKTDYKHDHYSQEEIQTILTFIKDGYSAAEISDLTGRSKGAINTLAYKVRKGQMAILLEENEMEKTESTTKEPSTTPNKTNMTPRDMIKALYDMGYRIENNQLVCYVRQTVKMSDIING